MRQIKGIILATMALCMVLFVVGCSSSDQSGAGVAKIDKPQEEADNVQIAKASTQSVDSVTEGTTEPTESTVERGTTTPKLTDEEITTNFAACLREHGFSVPDPELNRDGTVNLGAVKQGISQDSRYQTRTGKKVLDDCLPLLQEATFVQERSSEDEIELQDNLLKFAQCLRDNGIKVGDPDFSNGVRASMRSLFEGINMDSAKVQEGLGECRELHFSGMQRRPPPR
jgi:hypothetical protein